MPQPIIVLASFSPKQGQEQGVEGILRGMVTPTRGEPGCLRYDLYRASDNAPAAFVLFETYKDAAALEAHRATAHYKDYRARIVDLLSAPIKVQLLQALNVNA